MSGEPAQCAYEKHGPLSPTSAVVGQRPRTFLTSAPRRSLFLKLERCCRRRQWTGLDEKGTPSSHSCYYHLSHLTGGWAWLHLRDEEDARLCFRTRPHPGLPPTPLLPVSQRPELVLIPSSLHPSVPHDSSPAPAACPPPAAGPFTRPAVL